MKTRLTRLFLVSLLFLAVGVLAACGENSKTEKKKEQAQQAIEHAANDTGTAVNAAGQAVVASGQEAATEIAQGAQQVGDTLEQGGHAVVGGMNQAATEISHGAQEVQQGAQEGATQVAQGAQQVQQGAEQAGHEVQQGAQQAATEVQQGAQQVGQGVQEGATQVAQGAQQVQQGAQEGATQVAQGAQQVGQGVQEGATQVAQGAQQAGQQIQQGAQAVVDAIPDVDLADINAALTPNVIAVRDQVVTDNILTVDGIIRDNPGFLVVYADNGNGQPGQVIGYEQLNKGENRNIHIPIDPMLATPKLIVQLVDDKGQSGVFEPGIDTPATDNNQAISSIIKVTVVAAADQFVKDAGQVTVDSVTVQNPSTVSIYADDGDNNKTTFGPLLGQTQINAGTSHAVAIPIDASKVTTDTLWVVVEENNSTVTVNDSPAAKQIWMVPHIRASDGQYVQSNDRVPSSSTVQGPAFVVDSVLMDAPGFVVVHANDNDKPGAVLGFAPVQKGLSTYVVVPIDTTNLTDKVWVMLHADTDNNQQFSENADAPVTVGNNPVMTQVQLKTKGGEE